MPKPTSGANVKVVRCTVTAVSSDPDMPYVLASAAPDTNQYALNEKVSGSLWGHYYRGQQVDVHLIPDAPRASRILAVHPVPDE